MHTRNSIALLLVHIGSYLLFIAAGVSGVGNPVNNIDVLQPIVRRSPATADDLFGWAAILHPVEEVDSGDSMDDAARKTRLELKR